MMQEVMRAVVENIPEYPTAVEVRCDIPVEGGAEEGLYKDPEGVGEHEEEGGRHDEAVFVHYGRGGGVS